MLRSILAFSFLSLGITVVGCDPDAGNSSTGSGSTSGSGSGAAVAEACDALAAAMCAKTQSCSSYAFELRYADMAQCKERIAAKCPQIFELEGSKTTPEEVKGCADSFASLACPDFVAGDLPAACDPSPGARTTGSLCGRDEQCASAQCGKKDDKANCGTCTKPIAEGGACPLSYECARGLKCIGGKCIIPGGENDACSDTAPCRTGFICKAGTCVKPAGVGETCTPLDDNCDLLQGLTCKQGVCQQFKTAGPDEPCGYFPTEIIFCKASGVCRKDSAGLKGTCVAPVADDMACDDYMGPGCLPEARCSSNVCTLDGAAVCK